MWAASSLRSLPLGRPQLLCTGRDLCPATTLKEPSEASNSAPCPKLQLPRQRHSETPSVTTPRYHLHLDLNPPASLSSSHPNPSEPRPPVCGHRKRKNTDHPPALIPSLCSVKAHPPTDKIASLQLGASNPIAADGRQRLHQEAGRDVRFESLEARLPLGVRIPGNFIFQGSCVYTKASSHSKPTLQHHPGISPENETSEPDDTKEPVNPNQRDKGIKV